MYGTIILKRTAYLMIGLALLGSLANCQTEDIGEGNGLSDPDVDPSFTITPVDGSANKFTLTAQSVGVLGSKWDLDDGGGMFIGKMIQPIFLPDAGVYKITHTAIGRGGKTNTISKEIVVKTPDPISGNMLKGAKLVDAADWAMWTVANPSSSATLVFESGSATLKATGYSGNGMYQSVNVVAGKKYSIDMVTSSTSGLSDSWFEVYCGYSVPVAGVDYSEGTKLRSINTWDGCGKDPFSAKISVIGCKPDNNKGIFTATTTGVVYMVIRGGGSDMKSGIKIQNIEMRPVL